MNLEKIKELVSNSEIVKFRSEVEKPISEVYEEINAKCNNFLRTQKGLQYLMLKYPHLSLEHAIREYYASVWMAENYDGV